MEQKISGLVKNQASIPVAILEHEGCVECALREGRHPRPTPLQRLGKALHTGRLTLEFDLSCPSRPIIWPGFRIVCVESLEHRAKAGGLPALKALGAVRSKGGSEPMNIRFLAIFCVSAMAPVGVQAQSLPSDSAGVDVTADIAAASLSLSITGRDVDFGKITYPVGGTQNTGCEYLLFSGGNEVSQLEGNTKTFTGNNTPAGCVMEGATSAPRFEIRCEPNRQVRYTLSSSSFAIPITFASTGRLNGEPFSIGQLTFPCEAANGNDAMIVDVGARIILRPGWSPVPEGERLNLGRITFSVSY